MSKLFVLVVCVFMFQSSAHALLLCNPTDDCIHYVVQVRQKRTPKAGTSEAGTSDAGTSEAGTSEAGTSDAGTPKAGTPKALCELDFRNKGIDRDSTQNLILKNRKVIEFLERQEKILEAAEKLLEEEEKRKTMKPLEGEGIPSGVSQKPKLKKRNGINFFNRGKRRAMTPLEEAVVSSENASKSSSASLPGIAVEEEGVLEVVICIEKFCKNLDGSKGARAGIYDEIELCTLKTIKDLIYFDDFAHAEFCNDEKTYTLKLTGLRDLLVVTEGEEIADESRG